MAQAGLNHELNRFSVSPIDSHVKYLARESMRSTGRTRRILMRLRPEEQMNEAPPHAKLREHQPSGSGAIYSFNPPTTVRRGRVFLRADPMMRVAAPDAPVSLQLGRKTRERKSLLSIINVGEDSEFHGRYVGQPKSMVSSANAGNLGLIRY